MNSDSFYDRANSIIISYVYVNIKNIEKKCKGLVDGTRNLQFSRKAFSNM